MRPVGSRESSDLDKETGAPLGERFLLCAHSHSHLHPGCTGNADGPNFIRHLHDTVAAICASAQPTDTVQTDDRRRQEHRRVETFDVSGGLGAEWADLITTVARISRLTWHKDTKSGFWHATEEVSLYACQAPLPAAEAGAAIRAHWGIENRAHYVRDVSFFGDHSRIRIAARAFARMRSFALNILRANAADNVSRELYVNAINPLHALAYRLT